MATRQNKKRKGRNNVNNRERTVTTLTEDPNTHYLVPTPSEEPAGANLMSSPFSVASSSGGNPSAFQISPSFGGGGGFGYNNFNMGPMHGNVHQQQPQHFFPPRSQPSLPPGQSDLEVLENLKEMIKNGQHEFYRDVPQPAALASIYLGPNAAQSPVPPHPEQIPSDYQGPGYTPTPWDVPTQPIASKGPVSPSDPSRRPARNQNKEGWDTRKTAGPPPVGGSQLPNNNTQTGNPEGRGRRYSVNTSNTNNTGNTNIKPNSASGPPSAGIKTESDSRHALGSKSSLMAASPGGSDNLPPRSRFDPMNRGRTQGGPPSGNPKPAGDRPGLGESTYGGAGAAPSDISPDKSAVLDSKDDARAPRDGGWMHRDGPPPDDRRPRDSDRPPASPTLRSNGNPDSRPGNDPAGRGVPPGPPRDQRYYDQRDRERDRDREHRERDWERERDRDNRRPDYRLRDDRSRAPTDTRRPPPEQRHYEPAYDRTAPARRYDSKVSSATEPLAATDRRLSDGRVPPSLPADDRSVRVAAPGDDVPVRPSGDAVTRTPPESQTLPRPDVRMSSPDTQAAALDTRVPPLDPRQPRPAAVDERRGATTDDHSARPSAARVTEAAGSARPVAEDRGARAPPASISVEDRNARKVTLEDRISRPAPSLQDRLSQPPSARPESSRLAAHPSLEERLSHVAVTPPAHSSRPVPPTDDRSTRPGGANPDRDRLARPGPTDDRNVRSDITEAPRPPVSQDERSARLEERPGRPTDRFSRPVTPVQDRVPPSRSSGYPPRSSSVVRDESRVAKAPPSPPHRSDVRDYRGPVTERDRPDPRSNNYRPDPERGYNDDRRSDLMDIDPPSRYADSRAPFPRPFSPPSSADRARDRERTLYPPGSPTRAIPSPSDLPPYDIDGDRRFTPRELQIYAERRRPWDEESYIRRNYPNAERDRFERDVPPVASARNNGWETRDERERRPYAPGSPPRPFDSGQRPLSSRLTEPYSGPPGTAPPDHRYPRDIDRSRYPPSAGDTPPPFSRVRHRSPSPVGRRTGPPGGSLDDIRPPMKRQRDDATYPPSSGYYSPLGRDRRASTDYPPRPLSPPPGSAGSYYDRPPPLSGGTAGSGGSGPLDRDYIGGRDRGDYAAGPSSYDRPRSPVPSSRIPPPGYGRGAGYTRGGDPRDDRRYNMPPPPPRNG